MRVNSALWALIGAMVYTTACAEEDSHDASTENIDLIPQQDDPVLASLRNSGAWERTPTPARIDNTDVDHDDVFAYTPDQREQALELARGDATWYSRDGQRYEVLYVLPDGATYGRLGPAPNAPVPEPSNDFGAEEGAPASERAGERRGAVYTDTTYDDRGRIYSGLTAFPLRVNGAMSGSGNTRSSNCSGAKVGPRAVLTASHCVLRESGTLQQSGWFNPGQINTSAINGSYPWHGVALRDWRVAIKYDYAVIYVDDSEEFVDLGWMGIEWYTAASYYAGKLAANRGYPCGPNLGCGASTFQRCAASPLSSKQCDGWMYGQSTYLGLSSYASNYLLEFYNDVSEGHSGSAIYSGNNVLGVVTNAIDASDPFAPCTGPRFRQGMFDDVCSWIGDANFASAFGQHSLCP